MGRWVQGKASGALLVVTVQSCCILCIEHDDLLWRLIALASTRLLELRLSFQQPLGVPSGDIPILLSLVMMG